MHVPIYQHWYIEAYALIANSEAYHKDYVASVPLDWRNTVILVNEWFV